MFGRVAGGVSRSHDQTAEVEVVTVANRFRGEAIGGIAFMTYIDLGRRNPRLKFPRAADEVGMNVRFEYMRNRNTLLSGHG